MRIFGTLLANVYLLCWDWDRWKRVLPVAASVQTRHGDVTTALGLMTVASGC
jgi:hypothetical protein